MLSIEEIARRLGELRLNVVAEKTGLHVNTLHKIKVGKSINPSYRVWKILNDYMQERCNDPSAD